MYYYDKQSQTFYTEDAATDKQKTALLPYTDEEYATLNTCDDFEYCGYDEKTLLPQKMRMTDEDIINLIRNRRERECFAVINRGQPWHDELTTLQKKELSAWYKLWLDATVTMTLPTKPMWLD